GATRTQYLVNGEPAGAETEFELGPVTNSVQVGNVYDLAPLTIEKVLDGDAEPPADATFGGEVTCTFHGNPVQFTEPRVFSGLTAAGSVVVHDLPIGAACTVTETDTAGADAVGYRPAQTVPIADDSRVEIVNTFTEG